MLRNDDSDRQLSTARPVRRVPSFSLLITWGPVVAIMALIYALSSRPELGGSGLFVGLLSTHFAGAPLYLTLVPIASTLDAYGAISAHLVEFALLAFALKGALDRQWPAIDHIFLAYLAAWLVAVLYGTVDEWHQSFVLGRHSDPMDVLVDGLGAAGALALLYSLGRYRSWRKRRARRGLTSIEKSLDAVKQQSAYSEI